MSSTMTLAMARTAAARMTAVPHLAGQSSAFSTARVLRNTLDGQAATASTRRGIAGLFPRRMGWGGALVLFSLGVADGTLSTTWYLSRDKKE
jgi:hypothetical protein